MLQLVINNYTPAAVEWNKAELAAYIESVAALYDNGIVTDKSTARHDRAAVNKVRKELDAARKDVKRRYAAPYEAFEAELKEMIAPLDRLAAKLDGIAKICEEEDRNRRRETLHKIWSETRSWSVPFERIFDNTWLYASKSEEAAIAAMLAAAESAEGDIRAITQFGGNIEANITEYLNGSTLSEVLVKTPSPAPRQADIPTYSVSAERNEYTPAPEGIRVSAIQHSYHITVTCSETKFDALLKYLDNSGIFFATEKGGD